MLKLQLKLWTWRNSMKKKKNEILAYLFQKIECRGRTQTDVAAELGYSQQYISKYIQDHQDR